MSSRPHEAHAPDGAWRWPNGARLAVWVVPNIEMFDEDVEVGGKPAGDTQALMAREYGNNVGLDRLRKLFAKYDIRVTAAVNARLAEVAPELLRELVVDGWELMGHGVVNNRRLTTYPPGQEGDVIQWCLERLTEATGQRPTGWLSPGMRETSNTLSHLVANGVEYVADLTNRDVPYKVAVDAKSIIAIPYTSEANDRPAYDHLHLTSDEFAALAIRQFDYLYEEAVEHSQVYCLGLHPYLSGAPHRMDATERILSHFGERDEVWFATGREIVAAFCAGMDAAS